MSGHDLIREIVEKHGKDRYPTIDLSFMKLMEEIGELCQAILKVKSKKDVMKEYGDIGLSLYNLGDKMGLDLDECMKMVVDEETRKFS